MSKGYSGLFSGTIGTTRSSDYGTSESYSDRGIELPESVQELKSKLKKPNDFVSGNGDQLSEKNASILSKETGVEYAKITIDSISYLIRGDSKGVSIPPSLLIKLKSGNSSFDFHTHPYDDDVLPSPGDLQTMSFLKAAIGQTTSKVITPNGKSVTYNERGIVEIGTLPNTINDELKKAYKALFGGKHNVK